jgi:hypothetical protein
MAETNDIGNLTEAKVMLVLVSAGYLVSQPFGNGHKYDLVAADGQKLFRIQCKTGQVKNGVLIFNAYSVPGSKSKNVTIEVWLIYLLF